MNNMVGSDMHVWSIAVEFQFYMLSPLLIYFMAKSDRPWMAPLLIFLISTVLNFLITLGVCPDAYTNVNAITG